MKLALLTSGQFVMPPLPEWGKGIYAPTKFSEVVAIIKRHSPYSLVEQPKDTAFITVPSESLAAAVKWTLTSITSAGVKYTAESFDCENFCLELYQTLCKMAAKAGKLASPCVGCISVSATQPWAGVNAGGNHALCVVMTELGAIVVESQNGQMTPIEAYPNRTTILEADGF